MGGPCPVNWWGAMPTNLLRAPRVLDPALLFDIQCCQSVIRKLVYGFMRRLDSSVNCIIKGILATSLRYTSRIRKHWCSLLYINS